ncbi:hypothetical protein DVH24_011437 [Malus domestica]|uniref:Uncharacterized protein n=1 Tax=Malus domestica TaxID=3750 RepID=A0A498K046_MALDO|nr:hypothetical protein DVH24_011437 [Malus domestica]
MAFSLSSFISPTIFTLSSQASPPAKSLKTPHFLISTKNLNRNLPGRAKNLPHLRREPDGEDYGAEDEIEDATSTNKFNLRDHWYPIWILGCQPQFSLWVETLLSGTMVNRGSLSMTDALIASPPYL